MKNILSYWDISLGFIAIGLGIFHRYKYAIFEKKRDEQTIKERERSYTYSRYKDDTFSYTMFYGLIVLGALFIYNRLKGNLPNIVTFIKDIFFY